MKKILLIGLIVLVALATTVNFQKTEAYTNGRMIDDAVYDNYATMDEASIQNFLNSLPNSCIKNYQSPYPIDYFTYGDNVPASRVIYRASQFWGLNPQVIITTLQKEESLVDGTAGCDAWRYNSAMGYDCPDGSSCPRNPNNAGFSRQVMKGSWLLKFGKERAYGNIPWDDDNNITYYGPMTKGNFQRCASCPVVYFDGVWSGVYIENGATASLYNYTPYFNQSFPRIFEGWFGSTFGTGGPPISQKPHPDGTLVKTGSEATVYLISEGQKNPIPSRDVFNSQGFGWERIKIATPGDIALTAGTPVGFREGTLLKGSAATIYIVDDVSGVLQKRAFPDWATFVALGYSTSEVFKVSDGSLPATTGTAVTSTSHPDGTLIKSNSDSVVYLIVNGQKEALSSAPAFLSQGFLWNKIKKATSADLALTTGTEIGFREGTLLKGSAVTIYIVDDVSGVLQKRAFADWNSFVAYRYSITEVLSVPNSLLPDVAGTDVSF